MAPAVDSLFFAVRSACSTAQWSRGVELSRAGAVFLDREGEEEVIFRIAARGGMIGRAVTLYPADNDWDCGCDRPEAGCEHVAAAIITWKRASEKGQDLTVAAQPAGRVGYRFRRDAGGLTLERVVSTAEGQQALESTLAAVASKRVSGPSFVAGQADLAVELALGTHRRGLLPRPLVGKVFARLAHCTDIELDGAAVSVSPEPVEPVVRVEDQGDGFRVRLVANPSVTESFANGVALCGRTLRPVGEPKLTGRELHELPRGRRYGPSDVAELMTEVLPSLRRRVPVEVVTDNLPETVAENPARADRVVAEPRDTLGSGYARLRRSPPRARGRGTSGSSAGAGAGTR